MTGFPGSPRVTRAALVAVDPRSNAPLRRITLQYNPDQLSRSLQIDNDAQRAGLPPTETLRLEAELDATDILERNGAPDTVSAQLAALEALIYPTSQQLAQTRSLAARGTLEIIAPDPPRIVFIFGGRTVPVWITEYSATEEAFGPDLTPIRAKISLTLKIDTCADAFRTYHRSRELLARRVGRGGLG